MESLNPLSVVPAAVSLNGPAFPLRPALGRSGRSIQTLPQRPIHHYEVVITPEVPPAKNRRVYQLWEDEALLSGELGGVRPVFDGRKNVYSARPLPIVENECEFTVDYYDNDDPFAKKNGPKKFTLALIKVGEINMQRLGLFLEGRTNETPFDAIQALDILLRHRPSLMYTTVGRCFYTPDSAALLQMDRVKLDKTLKGLKVAVTHRGQIRRKYRIARITLTPASRTMFPLSSTGQEESVANYFMQKYNAPLYFPHLPCLIVGDPAKLVYLPMEVCEVVPGQRHLRKLNERQTAEMIKFTCQPPHVRSNKISAGITILQQRDNEYLNEFDVTIGHEMASSTPVFSQPPLFHTTCLQRTSYHSSRRAWNLRDKMVAQGVTIRSWSVVAFGTENDYPVQSIQKFITLLVQTCEECGVFVQNRQPPISYANPHGNVEKTLIDAYMVAGNSFQERPQLVICILPNTGVPLYAEIKRVSDTVIGLATQCIQAKHMFAAKRQYCAKFLGGMNSFLSNAQLPFVSERPTIIFGADVTVTSAPGSASTQSIAALVGSMDAQCSRYAAAIRVQKGRQEMIQDLASMVVELLKTFYQTCGAKPERICFFRDGVSEAMRLACSTLEASYRLHYLHVVQKRHHARFFPIRKEDSDRSGNVLPGTVVETGVTHPSEFDFYLCSHPGLQGTSKPTHYHVLYDENRFTSDSLQELTYRLCYLYCRFSDMASVMGMSNMSAASMGSVASLSTGAAGNVGGMVGAVSGLAGQMSGLSMDGSSMSMANLAAGPVRTLGSRASGYFNVNQQNGSAGTGGSLGFVKSSAGSQGIPGGDGSGEGGVVRVMNYGVVKSELSSVMWFM
ncbi:Piwi-domain-containing protein [Rhizoclosmatium globosum]|uniref:Piwi-domain-containing protein n=1 Tax=Rhizoclosmatium globosum TaxID=329046 RepID=A0A1Y2CEW8_9FUNG|nr:Piwi-domain-containing protein [Rhizoclosmatium globosum]|eukprot:ORY45562.1 Piwi-domain-containing protein [Rhizoclosmatium globosum]